MVVAWVSERAVGQLRPGAVGHARLVTGEVVDGTVRYVSRVAEPKTRTYRIELEIPNPDYAIPAGMTTGLTLPLESVASHFISPSLLSLDEDGALGVKVVDSGGRRALRPGHDRRVGGGRSEGRGPAAGSDADHGRPRLRVPGRDRDPGPRGRVGRRRLVVISLINAALGRPRTVLLLLILILVTGSVAYVTIPKESDPDINIPLIYVSMKHDGISPGDAERPVAAPHGERAARHRERQGNTRVRL